MRIHAYSVLAISLLSACGSNAPGAAGSDAAAPESGAPLSDAGSTDATRGPDAALAEAGSDASAPSGLGATVTGSGVLFRVWAPNATGAWVEGDFAAQEAAMQTEPGGIFGALVPDAHAGTTYHFALQTSQGRIQRLDPYCRQVLADGSGCTVIDPRAYAWKSGAFTRPAREASVVYEMHVPSFSVAPNATQGTFAQAATRLPDLADLGVNVIEILPSMDFGGASTGWGYNPQLYMTPKPGLGTSDDLRAFVDTAHALGIAVWLDTVINHCDGWKQAPLACFDGACPSGSNGIYFFPPGPWATTPWGPRPSYPDPEVAGMLLAAARTWIDEFHGDGFRWDSVSNVRGNDGNGTTPGGKPLLVALNDVAHAAGAMSVAEDLKGLATITQTSSMGGFGFDAQWDGFGYEVTGVLTNPSDAARDLGAVQGALTAAYNGDPFARLIYLESHDTVGNGGARIPTQIDPANPTSYFARKRSILGAALLLTTPGVPMFFMGEDWLATAPFGAPPAPLAGPTALGVEVRAFFKDMIALRRNVAGNTDGLVGAGIEILHRDDTGKVIAYRRHGASGKDVIVVMNFKSTAAAGYKIGVPAAGPWQIRLDSDSKAYGQDFGGGTSGAITATAGTWDGKPFTLALDLAAYGAVVLSE